MGQREAGVVAAQLAAGWRQSWRRRVWRLAVAVWLAGGLFASLTLAAGAEKVSPQSDFRPALELLAQAREQAPQPRSFTLDNGMQLVVLPDHRAPVVVQMLWVRAGATDEVDGSSGLAHALEHMMFKGTPTVAAGDFSRRVAAMGGSDNAFTSRDYTAYYQRVPASALEQVMQLEADRFAHTRWSEQDFDTEMQVIREERRSRVEDSPRALLHEAMSATMYAATPYGRPVIGWMGDIEELQSEELEAFYRDWYQPGNAALVVVGDVQVEQVRAWAQQYFAGLESTEVPVRKKRAEPPQKGMKRMQYKAVAEQPYVAMTWQVPQVDGQRLHDGARLFAINPEADDAGTADAYALVVLAAILDGNSGARLPRALTQGAGSVADSVGAYMGLAARGPNTFTVVATPAGGKTVAQLERAIRAEIATVAAEGVQQQELERVKVQWAAEEVYAQDSVMGKARNIGRNWALGWPLNADARVLKKLASVNAADVQRVAKTYFTDDTLTVAELVPQPAEGETETETEKAASLATSVPPATAKAKTRAKTKAQTKEGRP